MDARLKITPPRRSAPALNGPGNSGKQAPAEDAEAEPETEPHRKLSTMKILVTLRRTLRSPPALLYAILGGMFYNYAAM